MDDKSIIADQLDDLEELLLPRRRTLLPWWMKVFSYLFLFMAAISVAMYPLAFMLDYNFKVALYGLESTDRTSFITLVVFVLFLLKGATSFGLLFEKDWAIELGLIDASVGAAICIFVGLYAMFGAGSYMASFRIELFFLIIYAIKLRKMQEVWKKSPAGMD